MTCLNLPQHIRPQVDHRVPIGPQCHTRVGRCDRSLLTTTTVRNSNNSNNNNSTPVPRHTTRATGRLIRVIAGRHNTASRIHQTISLRWLNWADQKFQPLRPLETCLDPVSKVVLRLSSTQLNPIHRHHIHRHSIHRNSIHRNHIHHHHSRRRLTPVPRARHWRRRVTMRVLSRSTGHRRHSRNITRRTRRSQWSIIIRRIRCV